ncbi:hypothetical protein C9374_009612 [Naegleria lovaniensis]|uniref:Uncharacterized protein n=1 Tax=Naegleria lovaniensis TaxID=51637 RepID=A0AA88GXY2_NAELO|nr:uncharacterized protein C9374_009612 [Naegleria lovaniensis]KAG2393035.1 hypothetical protein C9374_009612 [Naegleria lovaniensis]
MQQPPHPSYLQTETSSREVSAHGLAGSTPYYSSHHAAVGNHHSSTASSYAHNYHDYYTSSGGNSSAAARLMPMSSTTTSHHSTQLGAHDSKYHHYSYDDNGSYGVQGSHHHHHHSYGSHPPHHSSSSSSFYHASGKSSLPNSNSSTSSYYNREDGLYNNTNAAHSSLYHYPSSLTSFNRKPATTTSQYVHAVGSVGYDRSMQPAEDIEEDIPISNNNPHHSFTTRYPSQYYPSTASTAVTPPPPPSTATQDLNSPLPPHTQPSHSSYTSSPYYAYSKHQSASTVLEDKYMRSSNHSADTISPQATVQSSFNAESKSITPSKTEGGVLSTRKALDEMMQRLKRDKESLQQLKTEIPSYSSTHNFQTQHTSSHPPYSYTSPQQYSYPSTRYGEYYSTSNMYGGYYPHDEYSPGISSHHASYNHYQSDVYSRGIANTHPMDSVPDDAGSFTKSHSSPKPHHAPNGQVYHQERKKLQPPSAMKKKGPPPSNTLQKKPKPKHPQTSLATSPSANESANNAISTTVLQNGTPTKKVKPPKPVKKKDQPASDVTGSTAIESTDTSSKIATKTSLRVRAAKQKRKDISQLLKDDSENELANSPEEEKYRANGKEEDEKSQESVKSKENVEIGENFIFSSSNMDLLCDTVDMVSKCTEFLVTELEKRSKPSSELNPELEKELIDLSVFNCVSYNGKKKFVKPQITKRKISKKVEKSKKKILNTNLVVNEESGETIRKGKLKRGPGIDVYEIICASRLEKLDNEELRKELLSNESKTNLLQATEMLESDLQESEHDAKPLIYYLSGNGVEIEPHKNIHHKSILDLIETGPIRTNDGNVYSINSQRRILELYNLDKKAISRDLRSIEKTSRLSPDTLNELLSDNFEDNNDVAIPEPSPRKKISPKRSVSSVSSDDKKKEDEEEPVCNQPPTDQKKKKRKFMTDKKQKNTF